MGGCTVACRVILVIFNLLFLLISTALIVVGAMLKTVPKDFFSYLEKGLHLVSDKSITIEFPLSLTGLPIISDLAVILLVFGCILFAIAFLAFLGACCKWRPLLIIYIVIVVLVVLIMAIVGGLFLVRDSTFHQHIKERLSVMNNDTTHNKPTGTFATTMNLLPVMLKCCGMGGPSDYATDWKKEPKILPMACCKYAMDTTYYANCYQQNINVTDIYGQGCYDKFLDLMWEGKTWMIISLVLMLVFLVIEVILAVIIVMDKDGKEGLV